MSAELGSGPKASPFGAARPVTTADQLPKPEPAGGAPPPGGEPVVSNRYVPPSRRAGGDAPASKPSSGPAPSDLEGAAPSAGDSGSRYVPPSRRGGPGAAPPSTAATPFVEGERPSSSRFGGGSADSRYAPGPGQQQRFGGGGGSWDARPSGDSRFGGGPFGQPRGGDGSGGGGRAFDRPREGGRFDGGGDRGRYDGSGFGRGGGGGGDFGARRDVPPEGNFGARRDVPPEERREFPGASPASHFAPAPPVEVDRERFKGLAPTEGEISARQQQQQQPGGGQFPGAFGSGGGRDGGYERPPMPAAFQGGRDGGGFERTPGGGQFPGAFGGGRDGGGYERPPMPAAFQGGRDGGAYDRAPGHFSGAFGSGGGGSGERPPMPAAFQNMGAGGRLRPGEDGPGGGGVSRWNPTGSSGRMGPGGGGGDYDRPSVNQRRVPLPAPTEGGKQELGNFIGKAAPAPSANALHHQKPAAAAVEPEPATDDAVQAAAAALGVDVSRATMAKKLRPVLDEFLTDTSKTREKKATAAVAALRTPEIAGDLARIFVEHALAQEKSGDRKQLAGLLNALRGVKPIALVSDAEVGAALSVAAVAAGRAGGPASDAGARVRHFVDELGKAPKGALAASALPADVQAFVAAAAAAADASAAAAAAAAAAELESAEGGPAAAAPTSGAAAASADAADESAAVDVAAVAAWLIKMDGKGLALRAEAQEKLGKVPAAKAAGPVMAAVLKHASTSGLLTLKSPFLAKEQFGHLLKWLCYDNQAASVEALIELQLVVNDLGYPKGLLAGTFMKLYEEEIVDEPAFWAWKDDRRDTPGKSKALIDAVRFFTWLQEAAADDEEDEEDSEVEEALKDVVRPNNSNKLR